MPFYSIIRLLSIRERHCPTHSLVLALLVCAIGLFALPATLLGQRSTARSGLWSDPGIWAGGVLPVNGEDVFIHAGDSVYLDTTTAHLKSLLIDGVLDGGHDTIMSVVELAGAGQFYPDSGAVAYQGSPTHLAGKFVRTYYDLILSDSLAPSGGAVLDTSLSVLHNFAAAFQNDRLGVSGSGSLDLRGSFFYRGKSADNWLGSITLTGVKDTTRHDTVVYFSAGLTKARDSSHFALPKIILAKPDTAYIVRVAHDSDIADTLFLSGPPNDTIIEIRSGTLDAGSAMIATPAHDTIRPLIRIDSGARFRVGAELPFAESTFDSTRLPMIECDTGSIFEYHSTALPLIDVSYLMNNIVGRTYDQLRLDQVVAACGANRLRVRNLLDITSGTSMIPALRPHGEQAAANEYLEILGDVINENGGESGAGGAGLRGCGMVSSGSDKWIFDRGNTIRKDTTHWVGPSMIGSVIIDSNTVLSIRFVNDTLCDSLDIVDSLIEVGAPCGGHLIGRAFNDVAPSLNVGHLSDDYRGLGMSIVSGRGPYLGPTRIIRTSGYAPPGLDSNSRPVMRYYNVVPTNGPQLGSPNHLVFRFHCDEQDNADLWRLNFWHSTDRGRAWSFSGRAGYDSSLLEYSLDTISVGFPDTSNGFYWALAEGYKDTPTPVDLLSFSVRPRGKAMVLSWSTASETNLLGFEITRTGYSGTLTLGSYATDPALLARSSFGASYSFIDRLADTGRVLYTLREISKDGIATNVASEWIDVQSISMAPHPLQASYIDDVITGSLYSKEASVARISIVDRIGREVTAWPDVALDAGENHLSLDAGLNPGVYFIRVQTAQETQICRFLAISR